MTKYNDTFELTVDDVELIEKALRDSKQVLSSQMMDKDLRQNDLHAAGQGLDGTLRQIQDLLGRMHNQKVFYRPRSGAYVGG